MIKGLIFDFDGLILDTEVPEYESWQRIFQSHGAYLAPHKWATIVGTSPQGFDVVKDLEQQIGKKVDKDKIHHLHLAQSLSIINNKSPQPGIVDYLNSAKRGGLRIGLASSSNRMWVTSHLERLGLLDYFECICTSDEVDHVKPDPELYRLALAQLELRPSEAIAFEDSPNGIQAAKSAGLKCVAVPNAFTRALDLSKADIIIDSMADLELFELIAKLHTG